MAGPLKGTMTKLTSQSFKLIITAALKKEVPKDWLASRGIPVHTLTALKAGALDQRSSSGIMVVITGAGYKASEEAARYVRDNLNPLFVFNIGTCGVINKKYPLGKWLIPEHVANEEGDMLKLDTRLPVPHPEKMINVRSLISVMKPSINDLPESLKGHEAIDMECYAQAKVFHDAKISFHCLKFSTDHSDHNTFSDFNRNVELFAGEVKKLFSFIRDDHRVTVIIPVHNRPHTIRRAIDSILSQSLQPEEIIVVDDCSTDGTQEILKSYGDKLTCVFLSENSGPSRARNEGVKYAKTEWIAFLDSDDCWEKDKLKNQIAYLTRCPFYQILQSEEMWIRNGVRVNPCMHHKKPEGWIWEQSLERCLVSPSGVLVKRSLLERYGLFDEGLLVCEDYDLWLKISRHHPVGLEPGLSVIKYGGHEDQLSRKYPAMDMFRARSLMKLLENEPHPEFREKIIDVLTRKLNILTKGYEKRKKTQEAEKCREMLASMSKYRKEMV
ncbi:MAG: glycosyltransferase [Nitrospirae bacterium]|nr:glycosyltransferase [Nitrospirota bacterium]